MGSARIMFRPALPTRCPSGTPLKSTTSALCPALQVMRPLGAEKSVNGSGAPGSHPATHGPEGRLLNICCACAIACALCCWLIRNNSGTVILETSRFVNRFGRIAVSEACTSGIRSIKRGQWSACLEVEKRVDLPAAQHLANKSTLLFEEWQFVNDISGKSMWPVIS